MKQPTEGEAAALASLIKSGHTPPPELREWIVLWASGWKKTTCLHSDVQEDGRCIWCCTEVVIRVPEDIRVKTCLGCKHLLFEPGEPGYSECTPGMDADMYCLKSHWKYDAYNETKDRLERKLLMAQTCVDFEEGL